MKKIASGLLALAATAALAGNAHAQIPNFTPFALEVRGGVALPQGDLKEGDVFDTGYTTGANLTYHFMPSLGAYVGFTRNSFAFKESDGGDADVKFNTSGIDAGLRLSVPTPLIPIDPFVKAGVIYHKVELDSKGGNATTDPELGFEVGAGVGINILPKLQLTPAVSYSQFKVSADEDEGETESANVSVLRLDIGLRLRI